MYSRAIVVVHVLYNLRNLYVYIYIYVRTCTCTCTMYVLFAVQRLGLGCPASQSHQMRNQLFHTASLALRPILE